MAETTPMRTRRTPGGKSFSSRNPTTIGAIGLVLIVAVLWSAFNAAKLPIIGGGTVYSAAFTEAAGLKPSDEVRVAGVKVGTVSSVGLAGDHVKVKFRIKHTFVGDQSKLSIKIKTLLGAKYLAIDSEGTAKQEPRDEIPTTRTTSPFDIYPAFQQLTSTVDQIDNTQLAQSFEVLAAAFKDTPKSVQTLVNGLSRLSNTVSSRDAELRTLLARANNVTGVLADRDQAIVKILDDGGLLLDELNARRDAIHTLLVNTSILSAQLDGLVADNQATIKPSLDALHGVLDTLQQNQDSLDRGLVMLSPFFCVFANTLGNGRWFDTYVQNLSLPGLVSGVTGLGSS